jgi:uncharacterized protein
VGALKTTGTQVVDRVVLKDNSSTTAGAKELLPLWIFLGVSLACSWTVWLSPFEKTGSFYITIFGLRFSAPFNLTKLMIGICIPGLFAIAWAISEGRQRALQMLSTILRWRVTLRWYVFALALPLVVFWVSLGVVLFYFPSSRPRPSLVWFFLNLLLLLPFGPLWEELAWRAYALRKLQMHFSELKSALVLGVYWAIWHIPLWSVTLGLNKQTAAPVLTLGVLSVIAWSVVFAFLYNRSAESLPVVILLYAAYDSAAEAIFPSIQKGELYYIGLSTILSACLAVFLSRSMSKHH